MRWSKTTTWPRVPKYLRGAATAGALALSGMALVACGGGKVAKSSSTTGSPASTSSLPTGTGVSTSTSPVGTTTTPLGTADVSQACPSLDVITAALHVTVTGPVVSVTPQEKVCTYKQNADSIVGIIVSFSHTTKAEFKAGEKNAVAHDLPVVTVPGLGNAAWRTKKGGEVAVLRGKSQVDVISPFNTPAQVEALVRQID
jgi:hypothetical protein